MFEPDIKKSIDKEAAKNFQLKKNTDLPKVYPTLKAPYIVETSREPGIYLLPQDNMPCIVPDVSNIAPIPNASSYFQVPKIGRMPGTGNKTTSILPPKSMVK